MLFYDEYQRLCVKITDSSYFTLSDNDIIEIENTKYCYFYEFFYKVEYLNGEPVVDLSNKILPRKLGLKRKEELFKDEWELLREQNSIKDEFYSK